MKDALQVVKIGGNIIDDEAKLNSFLKDFAQLTGPKILVHGGGKIATEVSKGLGIEARLVDGRRITDAETLRVVTMVYGGLVNKNIVAKLQANNCNALGLTGADADIIPATKRPVKDIDYGFVGDITEGTIPAKTLKLLLENNLTPVIAPLTHDGQGNLLNTNADTIASALAVALSGHFETRLTYCFEKKGVLTDINDDNSVIHQITNNQYTSLKNDGTIAQGMIPKLDNAFRAIAAGVTSVFICHADDVLPILEKKATAGTELVNS
ncbi:acetylglutamate kinase [Adhaeribacter rhizoryzae]|uniref:Acetylglutamate kinase n=1 Tax=Adhaeribacter rhizoryzae TaxID=2607907 RepID=A0A5M6DJV3_9BACT|nr:acetylglutamate kinase [Adhaeribacter rhizoryzae]KAA5547781.1 acetylglutamate kinase [Adhaeribacter rhizoryzae]